VLVAVAVCLGVAVGLRVSDSVGVEVGEEVVVGVEVDVAEAVAVAVGDALGVNVGTGVLVAVGIGVFVAVGVAGGALCSTNTQSPSPVLLVFAGVNCCEPLLANGEPAIGAYVPLVGSYHWALTGPESVLMSTVIVRGVGR
jgi:hypothetical protein